MNVRSAAIEKYGLPAFLILTFLSTALVTFSEVSAEVAPILMVLLPALLAIILTAISSGKQGVGGLLRRLSPRLSPKWYLIVLIVALLLRLSMSVIALLLGWIPEIRLRSGSAAMFVGLGVLLFVAAVLEEIGWRGYALPRFLKRRSALASALLIGIIWGLVHLFLLMPGMIYAGEHPVGLIVELVGLSVVVTWLFVQTGGNIFVTSLYHAAQSFFVVFNEGMTLTHQIWSMAAAYVVLSVILVVLYGPSLQGRLARPARELKARSEL